MAGDAGEEAAIERQLEQQLDEQRESLAAVSEALASEPSNPELLADFGVPVFYSQAWCTFLKKWSEKNWGDPKVDVWWNLIPYSVA